jgi:6-phosphofructokinase
MGLGPSLRRLEVSYLVTIGGNDTAFASARIAAALAGQLAVAHNPWREASRKARCWKSARRV